MRLVVEPVYWRGRSPRAAVGETHVVNVVALRL